MNNMRRGFTMIELIFVIVIIGILAAVAIPKLAATRDDAKISKAVANLKTCVNDIGAAYTATSVEDNTSAACVAVVADDCFSVDVNVTTDGNVSVADITSGSAGTWCTDPDGAQDIADSQGLNSVTHYFGGSRVVR